MALTSISLNNGATVIGRVLARNGQVSLINNVLTRPLCATGSTTPPYDETPSAAPGNRRAAPEPRRRRDRDPARQQRRAAAPRLGRSRPAADEGRPAPRNGTALVRPVAARGLHRRDSAPRSAAQ